MVIPICEIVRLRPHFARPDVEGALSIIGMAMSNAKG
jgi:hypothetical protein